MAEPVPGKRRNVDDQLRHDGGPRRCVGFAEQLAPSDDSERTAALDTRDQEVVMFAHGIWCPGITFGAVAKMIRLGERGSVAQIIAERE